MEDTLFHKWAADESSIEYKGRELVDGDKVLIRLSDDGEDDEICVEFEPYGKGYSGYGHDPFYYYEGFACKGILIRGVRGMGGQEIKTTETEEKFIRDFLIDDDIESELSYENWS